MKFKSQQIKGKGRGKLLGYPTINLKIPENFQLPEGIYAVRVYLSGLKFIGALHFGPIPAFSEETKTLEVFLINITDQNLPETENLEIEFETIKYLRPVKNFASQEELIKQIGADVEQTKKIATL